MNIKNYPPKLLRSNDIFGVKTNKLTVKRISPDLIIVIENWQQKPLNPFHVGNLVSGDFNYKWISKWQLGKNYLIQKILDDKNNLVGFYCDVCSQIKKNGNFFECFDWYLDVWQVNGGEPEVLDEDEFELAISKGYLNKEEAQAALKATSELLKMAKDNLLDFNF